MVKAKSFSKTILMAVLSILVVLAMMPATAFAGTGTLSGYEGEFTSEAQDITIHTGGDVTLTADAEVADANGQETDAWHIDWTTTASSTIISVGKHSGQVVAVNTDNDSHEVTVVGTLRPYEKGTGSGNQGANCSTDVLDTITFNITVDPSTTYGYQGLNNNTMKLTSPSNITPISFTDASSSSADYGRFLNRINSTSYDEVTVGETDYYQFAYTMTAGMNKFKEATFDNYKNDIKIYSANQASTGGSYSVIGSAVVNSATYITSDSSNVYIGFPESSLPAGHYILRFGPSVSGNNPDKNLGAYVDFMFVIQ